MMDQYNKETSQIHAPADLIQKTKQAVREEERRIERVRAQQTVQTMENTGTHDVYADKPRRNSYGKMYKWALPVAAAVLLGVLMNASTMMIGRKFSSSKSDAPMEIAAEMAGGAEESGEAAIEESVVNDMDGGIDKTFGDNGFVEESIAEASESTDAAAEVSESDIYEESDMSEAPAASAEFDNAQEAEMKSDLSEDSAAELTIEEVEVKPEFVGEADTEQIITNGQRFYVTGKGGDMWKTYVYFNKQGYMVTGNSNEAANSEEFVKKAYELLIETVERAE